MLIRAETSGQSLRIHGKKGCRGGEGGWQRANERKGKEKRGRGGKKEGERVLRGKGEDVGPLKEDAARRSQLSHLVVNP